MDKEIIKAAIEAIRKEMRGRVGKKFAPKPPEPKEPEETEQDDAADPLAAAIASAVAKKKGE